jgi:Rrf2 family protein
MLSATSAHALRSLICLAQLPEGKSITGAELAEIADVPRNYLSKILHTLGHAGLVIATRGSGGGYRLAPGTMSRPLFEIVEYFEGTRAKPACLLGQKYPCSDENPCPAHHAWRGVRTAYLDFLGNTTLADIARYPLNREQLFSKERQ